MKLLLITENWPPRIGGIERYLHGLTTALRDTSDVEVHVVEPHTQRIFWPIIKPAWLPLFVHVWRLVKREHVDAVLCGKALFEGLLGYYLKKYLNIPYIVFTYGLEINTWAAAPRTKRKLIRVLTNADRVIVINESIRKTIVDLGVAPEKIEKIYPALSAEFEEQLAKSTENKAVLEKFHIKKPYILSVARLIPRKGIDDLIRAFAKLDQVEFGDVQLVIAGEGPARNQLQHVAESEYVQPIFTGEVSEDELAALYAHATVFALTPKDIEGDIEGYGIVYLEAAASSLPIIATRTGGVAEAVETLPNNHLVEPGDIGSIASALTQALKSAPTHFSKTIPTYTTRAQQLLTVLHKLK